MPKSIHTRLFVEALWDEWFGGMWRVSRLSFMQMHLDNHAVLGFCRHSLSSGVSARCRSEVRKFRITRAHGLLERDAYEQLDTISACGNDRCGGLAILRISSA